LWVTTTVSASHPVFQSIPKLPIPLHHTHSSNPSSLTASSKKPSLNCPILHLESVFIIAQVCCMPCVVFLFSSHPQWTVHAFWPRLVLVAFHLCEPVWRHGANVEWLNVLVRKENGWIWATPRSLPQVAAVVRKELYLHRYKGVQT
jgi:hypothetical protein